MSDPYPWVIPDTYDALTGEGDLRFPFHVDGSVWQPRAPLEPVRGSKRPTEEA